ncbi:MAG: hypothetical protein ACD_83C00133G0003 [uncultured bacterium]|uniref:Elongation factor Ts n=1 Tax=Berkelbacteria bacterium GW2011_GWA2_38_9 TaxID=1618334 RepID=A0A0G0LF13_9BACT|nr:MAG: hypothetical protein ACD_83C00133G0003 [uncultured bacterium]KKQ90478.1 MAG: Elongation factor Ts [Berkelbacteria bacterium GW2011_GWA2_38_9]
MYSIEDVKKLREATEMSIMDIKSALTESKGDFDQARAILKKRGAEISAKKSSREASEGVVESYSHQGRIGVLVEVNSETDFVARNPEFKELAHELALQISAMNPTDVEDLLEQEYIRDGSQKVRDLLQQKISKLGENIVIKRFIRFALGE